MILASEKLTSNTWSLKGDWDKTDESIMAKKNAKLSFVYNARDVYLVLSGSGTVTVRVNGESVDTIGISGKDSKTGIVHVDKDALYHLVHENNFQKDRLLELEFSPGI